MNLFDTEHFLTRRQCGDWPWSLIWTHAIADLAIFLAYMILATACGAMALRGPEFRWRRLISSGFAIFISACGLTHLMDAITFLWPAYRFEAAVKIYTGAVSLATAAIVLAMWPRLRNLPTAKETLEAGLDLDKCYRDFVAKLDTSTTNQGLDALQKSMERVSKLARRPPRGE